MHYSFVFEGLMHFVACVDHSPPSLHPQIGLLRLSAQLCFCLNVESAVVPLSIQAVLKVEHYRDLLFLLVPDEYMGIAAL